MKKTTKPQPKTTPTPIETRALGKVTGGAATDPDVALVNLAISDDPHGQF